MFYKKNDTHQYLVINLIKNEKYHIIWQNEFVRLLVGLNFRNKDYENLKAQQM